MKRLKLALFLTLVMVGIGPVQGWSADTQKKPLGQSPVGSTLKTDQTYQRSTQSASQDCEKLVSGQAQGTLQPKVDKTDVTTDAFGNTTTGTTSRQTFIALAGQAKLESSITPSVPTKTVTPSSQQAQGTLQPKVDKTNVTTDASGNTTVTKSYSQKVCK